MHLNFLDTSPLKVFVSSLRSKLRVCLVDSLLAELTLTNRQDRSLQLAPLAACILCRPAASPASKFKMIIEEGVMAKRDVRYPHTIGFRITDETWLRIEQEIAETDLTAHDWCRNVVLDRLDREYDFSKKERPHPLLVNAPSPIPSAATCGTIPRSRSWLRG